MRQTAQGVDRRLGHGLAPLHDAVQSAPGDFRNPPGDDQYQDDAQEPEHSDRGLIELEQARRAPRLERLPEGDAGVLGLVPIVNESPAALDDPVLGNANQQTGLIPFLFEPGQYAGGFIRLLDSRAVNTGQALVAALQQRELR